jgi:hypothetical protein
MACARDSNYQNSEGKQPVTTLINRCLKYRGFLPSFTPVINNLSVFTSVAGVYSLVYINGSNFFPPCNGTTYVDFGTFKQLPITFYSSFNISFVVPLNANAGEYNVVVVNVYNGNFSPAVYQSFPGKLNYSNSITYTIT